MLRHLAQGFAMKINFWTVENAMTISKATISRHFNPETRFTHVPPTPNEARQHNLDTFLWELQQYLPDEHKHIMNDEKAMAEVSVSHSL